MKNFKLHFSRDVFLKSLLTGIIFSITFSFAFFALIANFSKYWIQDTLNVLSVTIAAAPLMASIMGAIFKKWKKILIIPAIIIQLPCTILMINTFFL